MKRIYSYVLEGIELAITSEREPRDISGEAIAQWHQALISLLDSILSKEGLINKIYCVLKNGFVIEVNNQFRVPRTERVFRKIIRNLIRDGEVNATLEVDEEEGERLTDATESTTNLLLMRLLLPHDISKILPFNRSFSFIGIDDKAPLVDINSLVDIVQDGPRMVIKKQCNGLQGDSSGYGRLCRDPTGPGKCDQCRVEEGKSTTDKDQEVWFHVPMGGSLNHPTWNSSLAQGKHCIMMSLASIPLRGCDTISRVNNQIEIEHKLF